MTVFYQNYTITNSTNITVQTLYVDQSSADFINEPQPVKWDFRNFGTVPDNGYAGGTWGSNYAISKYLSDSVTLASLRRISWEVIRVATLWPGPPVSTRMAIGQTTPPRTMVADGARCSGRRRRRAGDRPGRREPSRPGSRPGCVSVHWLRRSAGFEHRDLFASAEGGTDRTAASGLAPATLRRRVAHGPTSTEPSGLDLGDVWER